MDVGFYLGELLMRQGEVKVPGLGIFSQVRMSAYYDENAALFYPPYNKVHFEQQADLDDAELAEYLVNRKGISLASATYFVEKYITNLRQQAIIADVPLGNMGVFYTDRAELSFKPNDRLVDDSELYGYAPVKINKANAIPVDSEPLPLPEFIYPRPKTQPEEPEIIEEENIEPAAEEYEEEPLSSTYDEAFLDLPEEEEESRGPLRGILISLVIVAVIAAGIFALYRYQPATFNKLQFWKNNKPAAPVKPTPKVIVVPKPDSLHTDSAKTAFDDSTRVITADTTAKARFELITGKGFKNLWAANEALKKYRAMGVKEAKFSEERPGNLIKISLGTFNSISESEAFKQKLIKEGKLNKFAYTIEIPKEN